MKEKLTNNLGLKAASLVFAVIMWFLVVNAVDPVVTGNIHGIRVEVLHPEAITDQGKVYHIASDQQTISISLEAKKTDLPSITANDFRAYVDMRYPYGVDESNQAVQIQIEVVNNRSIIDEDSIQFRSNDVLYFTTEDVIEREMKVEVDVEGELAENYRLNNAAVLPETIVVTAPETIMSRVNRAIVKLDQSALTSDVSEIIAKPIILDANGTDMTRSVTLSEEEVKIQVSLLRVKEIAINCDRVSGTPAEGYRYSDLSIEPQTVTVVGSKTALADLSHILIPSDMLNVNQAVNDVVLSIDLHPYLPEGVQLKDGADTVTVTLHVEQLKTKTYRLPVDNIVLENRNSAYDYDIKGLTTAVVLTGLEEDLDVLTVDQLLASVDVQDLELGTHEVTVELHLESGYTLVEPVTVKVVVRDPNGDTEAGTDEEEPESDSAGVNSPTDETEEAGVHA